jgi:hypothetical protein
MPILTEGAIDRILAAAGNVPAGLDRDRLFQDLESIAAHHKLGVYARREPAKRCKEMNKLIAAVEKVRGLIQNNRLLVSLHHTDLERLINSAKKLKSPADQLPDIPLGVGEVSAAENLISKLVAVFEDHFRPLAASYTKVPSTNVVKGPFIDFAEAALKETGAPYARRSIADALAKTRRA